MAESTKEQIKNQNTILDQLTKISEKTVEIAENFRDQFDAATTVETAIKAQQTRVENLNTQYDASVKVIEKSFEAAHKAADDLNSAILSGNAEAAAIAEKQLENANQQIDNAINLSGYLGEQVQAEEKKLKLQQAVEASVQAQADKAKELGDKMSSVFNVIPGGATISKFLGFDTLGDDMSKSVIDSLDDIEEDSTSTGLALGGVFNGLTAGLNRLKVAFMTNPFLVSAAAVLALATAVMSFRKAARDTAAELEISAQATREMTLQLKMAEGHMKVLGFDSSKLQTTLAQLSEEFGTMEMITVENAKNIEMMAQEMGVAGIEIVKFNKVMMDLTGASFDVATNIAQSVADLADSEGVAVGRVMKDVATNAETFAKFSMDGAEGLARAAVEAAKIGGSLSEVLKVADDVLKLETSISNQFKAQVITGKQINLETARRLALEGDIEGLTREVQDIVRNVGDLQTMNVIERQSIADALGISVRELQRISRGEAQQERESVQDKLDVTNKLLAQLDEKAAAEYALLEGGIDTNDATVRVFT